MRLSELAELEQEQALSVEQSPRHAAQRIAALSMQCSRLREELEQMRSEREALREELERALAELDLASPRFRLAASLTVEVSTVSEANVREHALARAGRAARQRAVVGAELAARLGAGGGRELLAKHRRVAVVLVRLGARRLDDDNLAGALKHVRDEVARWLGCDDGPTSPVRWQCDQEAHRRYRLRPAVRIELLVQDPRTQERARQRS